MTLDEAIKHCEEVADSCKYNAKLWDMTDAYESHVACGIGKCAEEHRQLAEWLKDYKRLLEQESCDDAISREEVLLMIDYFKDNYGSLIDLAREIRKMPPVNPQKTGHWIEMPIDFKCSKCNNLEDKTTKYCPNCGVRMIKLQNLKYADNDTMMPVT